jgi:hypothetical protein
MNLGQIDSQVDSTALLSMTDNKTEAEASNGMKFYSEFFIYQKYLDCNLFTVSVLQFEPRLLFMPWFWNENF